VKGSPALEIRDVTVRFGGLTAVRDVGVAVAPGEILGLIGPNGAGKTTLLNAISGLVRVTRGEMLYGSPPVDLATLPGSSRARLGIARTFQDSRLVEDLTVLDQLLSGAFARRERANLGRALLRTRSYLAEERDLRSRAASILADLQLNSQADVPVREVPAPTRRMVDLARALMIEPSLLLLDETCAGMTADQKELIAAYVERLSPERGVTVVFVEHDIGFVRRLAQRIVIMAEGGVMASGRPDDVLGRADVLETYIGKSALGAVG
jgi:branched-chain amino acid transport system ATP-binding protein